MNRHPGGDPLVSVDALVGVAGLASPLDDFIKHYIDNHDRYIFSAGTGGANPASGTRQLPHSPRVPSGGENLVHDLPQAQERGKDAGGAAPVGADDPLQPRRDLGMEPAQREQDRRAIEFLIAAIDETTLAEVPAEPPRSYIGASVIGTPCEAYLALSLRGFPNDQLSAQLRRIFDEGHRVEPFVVGMLKKAGVTLQEVDPATGKQWHFSIYGGHVAANLDGMVWMQADPATQPPTHTLEVKSMQRKLFVTFTNKGVAHSHPEYYDQVQLGLGLSGMKACLFVAFCKDNSKFHAEFVYFDEARYQELLRRAARAMFSPAPERNETWDCSMCSKRTACKAPLPVAEADRLCRHCKHAMPDAAQPGKRWTCMKSGASGVETPCGEFEVFRPITVHRPSSKPRKRINPK